MFYTVANPLTFRCSSSNPKETPGSRAVSTHTGDTLVDLDRDDPKLAFEAAHEKRPFPPIDETSR